MAQVLREGLVLGLGNPLLDISAVADQDLLQKYDMKPNNAILAEDQHIPLYNELITKYKVEYTAGGSTQNTLRAAQWVLKKPGISTFMGCVGKDDFSNILETRAKADGVNVRYQYNDKEPTGTCAVIITDKGANRSLCANLAAANCFTNDHIKKAENRAVIENAEYYYISGFFLTVNPESILEVAQYASEKNRMFMMNLSAPFLSKFFREPMMKAFPYVDIIFGNETEAETFAEEQKLQAKSREEIALKMAELPKINKSRSRIVIITQGQDPVLLAKDGSVTKFPAVQVPDDKIVDTNGAGDAFVGGFLSQLVQGKPIETCIKCGIWVATEVIQRSGCSFEGEPTFQE